MENETTKKTEQRVVLNLSMGQAKELRNFIWANTTDAMKGSIIATLHDRVAKTITKHETSMEHEAFKMAEERDDRQDREDAEMEAQDGN